MQKYFSLMIAPSYRCNANCQYCYTKGYINKFKKDMDFLTFVDLVDIHRKQKNFNLNIIGGEPTIWKHINKSLLYCKLRGIKTTVFSNGLKRLKIMPFRMYLNSSQYFEKGAKEKFIESLAFYFRKKVKIVLRYNIEKNSSEDELDEIIALAEKYQADIHLALVVPYVINKDYGTHIFAMFQKIVSTGVKCQSANPIPPCMFEEDEIGWMKKNVKYYSSCDLGGIPLINPDGKTVQPCSKMFLFKKMGEVGLSRQKIKSMYKKEINIAKKMLPLEKCRECHYYIEKKCFGGCMAFRANDLYAKKM